MLLSRNFEIPPIFDAKQRYLDESLDASLTEQKHILDHILGWGDLSVAVVPCELGEVQEIESKWRPVLAE
jgi:hypothetical protein